MDLKLSFDVNRRLSIIDFSSFDDCLIDSLPESSPGLGNNGTCDFNVSIFEDGKTSREKVSQQMDLLPMVAESLEPKQIRKAAKCNLRKSLAWNSAFFTSEGVLDPDELAIVTEPSKKTPIPCLPGIEEDLRKSSESSSTIGSESRALGSIEVDLLQDLRASTGKSADEENDKSSDISSCSSRTGQGKLAALSGSSQKAEPSSKNRGKSATPFKKHNSSRPPLDRKPKETLSRPAMGALRVGDQKLPSITPKSLSRIQSRPAILDQRVPPTARSIRASTDTGSRQHAAIFKKPVLHNSVPSSKLSPSTLPSFSYSSNQKISSSSLRKKSESKHSDLIAKTPVRVSAKKSENSRSKFAKKVTVASKPIMSPSSSIDSLSSVASSSTPTATNQLPRSNSSCVISWSNSHSQMNTSMEIANQLMGKKSHVESSQKEMCPNIHVPQVSLGNILLSQSSVVDSLRSKGNNNVGLQPSGLRVPRPKCAFFDAGKSPAAKVTPNDLLQSDLEVDGIKMKHHVKQPYLKSTLKEVTDTKTCRQGSNFNIQEYRSTHALKNSMNLQNANLLDKSGNKMKDKEEHFVSGEQVSLSAVVEDLDLGVLIAEKVFSPANASKPDSSEVLKTGSSFEVLSPSKKFNLEHSSPIPGSIFNSPTKRLTVRAPLSVNSSIMNKSGSCESKDKITERAMEKTSAILVSEKSRDGPTQNGHYELEDENITSGSAYATHSLDNQKENNSANSFSSLSRTQ